MLDQDPEVTCGVGNKSARTRNQRRSAPSGSPVSRVAVVASAGTATSAHRGRSRASNSRSAHASQSPTAASPIGCSTNVALRTSRAHALSLATTASSYQRSASRNRSNAVSNGSLPTAPADVRDAGQAGARPCVAVVEGSTVSTSQHAVSRRKWCLGTADRFRDPTAVTTL